jgi:hypothetical protein
MTFVSLREQIEEVDRELVLRARVYPGQVATGKMRQSVADYHMNRMLAVRETLTDLRAELERKAERAKG